MREAIALLNSLLGSNMNSVLKKSLASKIIQKITKIQASTKGNNTDDMSSHNYSEVHPRTEPSTKCSSHSQGVSGVSTFSDPSKCKQSIPSKKTSSSSESRERVLKEFLQPMTYSEVDYQNHQIIRETKQKNTVNQKKNKNSDDQEGSTVSHNSVSKRNLPLLDFVRKEKQSQLNWIEKEILHLSNLRDLLAKNVDTSADTTMRPVQTSIALENKTSASNTKDSKSNYSSKSKSEESKKSKISESMVKRQKTQTEYSTQSNTSNKDTSNEKPKKEVKSGRFIDWDSHTNMKKIMKNRSKLETPDSDESIVSFINKRKDQFLEKYEKKKKQERHNNEALYTKPCSREAGDTDHYSEPIEKRNMQQQNMFSTTKNSPIINASTSLASSEVFVSSQSISIPVANSTNNTTTHHYDLNGRINKKLFRVISHIFFCSSETAVGSTWNANHGLNRENQTNI